ncbi:MAG: hypothetical protein HXY35_12925 [Chloroflexi bacterium]|nr:hypothetical protein [Chloroflexota bacterium]
MARKSPSIEIQEIPGDHFASLDAAQRAALDPLAAHMAQTIRDLLARGVLAQVNGKIIPNTDR